MDKDVYIYVMEYHSAIKKNETTPFAARWVDPETVIMSEVCQAEKDKYCMIPLICRILKNKKRYKCAYLQNRNWFPDLENEFMVKGGGVGVGTGTDGVWDWQAYTAKFKINNQLGSMV